MFSVASAETGTYAKFGYCVVTLQPNGSVTCNCSDYERSKSSPRVL